MKWIGLINSFDHRGANPGSLVAGSMGCHTIDDRDEERLSSTVDSLYAQVSHLTARFLGNRYAILTMRWVLATVFIISASGKLVDIGRYSIAPVMDFGILPIPLARVFGAVLPFIEAFCALGLLLGFLTRFVSLGALIMSATFFIAKEIALWQGGDIECGCFGAVVTTLASLTVYMDPPMMFMSLAILLSPRRSRRWFSLAGRFTKQTIERIDHLW